MYIDDLTKGKHLNIDEIFLWVKGRIEYYDNSKEFVFQEVTENTYHCHYRSYDDKEKRNVCLEYVFNLKDMMLISDANISYYDKFGERYVGEMELVSFSGNCIELLEYSKGFLGMSKKKRSMVSSLYIDFAHISNNTKEEMIKAVNFLIRELGGRKNINL